MPTNWVILTRTSLKEVLSLAVLKAADQNIDAQAQPNDLLDENRPTRSQACVDRAVAQVRGSIKAAGRFPLSVTPGAVPPAAVRHTLHLAAWWLVGSTPNIASVVMGDEPIPQKFYKDAVEYLKALSKGSIVERPSDPTGQDYESAITDLNPAIRTVLWGDVYADDEDYEAGYITTTSGSRVALPVDEMRTDIAQSSPLAPALPAPSPASGNTPSQGSGAPVDPPQYPNYPALYTDLDEGVIYTWNVTEQVWQ